MPALVIVHPFLIAILPILLIYTQNYAEADTPILFLLSGMSLAVTGAVMVVGRLLLRDWTRAACCATAYNLLFFTYGRLFDYLAGIKSLDLSYSTWHNILGVLYVSVLVATVFYLRRTQRDLVPVSRFLSGVFTILLVFMLVRLGSYNLGSDAKTTKAAKAKSKSTAAAPADDAIANKYPRKAPLSEDSPDLPDIYYIIPDAYARQDVLQNVCGFDNSQFIDFLRSRGFYVADKSCSNYPYTMLSIPSSMNMRYVEEEVERQNAPGKKARNSFIKDFQPMMLNPLVAQILQSKGYRYFHFRTNTWVTKGSECADEVVGYYPAWLENEFTQVVLRTTPLRLSEPKLAHVHLNTLSQIEKISKLRGPKFVFAHMICPHRPFVFNRDGSIRENEPQNLVANEAVFDAFREGFVDQTIFLNKRLEEVIDNILANSRTTPIIIIQSDHGPDSLAASDHKNPPVDWNLYTRERLPILNAYLVPEKMKGKLYPTISPVNSFRMLFTECFGEKFELLPERHYIGWYNDRFKLRDATEVVTTQGPPPVNAGKIVDDIRLGRAPASPDTVRQ